jgi:D-alanine transaminase/branched-chain amino acid aminotransferase
VSPTYSLINGELVPAEQARLHVGDLAIQRGYGIFDFFRTHRGRPVFLDDHLDRFYRSASRMRLECRFRRDELVSLLSGLIAKNGIADSGVRLTLTGGYSPDGYDIASPNLIVTQRPLTTNRAPAERGIRLITHPHRRQFPDVKTIDYLTAVWLQPLIRERAADDVLYHHDGTVTECPRSNLFIVTADDRLITPAGDVLEGVTRKQVLHLAARRFEVEEAIIGVSDVLAAREAFLTSTTRAIAPVIQVDGRPIGDGGPGHVTRQIADEFDSHLAEATK